MKRINKMYDIVIRFLRNQRLSCYLSFIFLHFFSRYKMLLKLSTEINIWELIFFFRLWSLKKNFILRRPGMTQILEKPI